MVEIIIVSIVVPAVVVLVSYIAKLIYSSKLGCIQIERDTRHEQKIQDIRLSIPKIN